VQQADAEYLQGTVTVVAAEQTVVLEAGDSLSFPGDVAHSYGNNGTDAARFSLAVFERGVGSAHREANNA
jgi:quercetin dioxygenase-like cupin family protein